MRTLLQIRQFAQLRSTTCSLQGLSSTQRSTQTTPSRDLTLGGKEQGTRQGNPRRLSSPRSQRVQSGKTVEGGTQVAVLPRCVRAIKPIGFGCAGQVPRWKAARAAGWRLSWCGRVLEVASLVNGRTHSQGSQSHGRARRVLEVAS
jgi:hypothetical protein